MRSKITKRAVDAMHAGTRATFLWDVEVPGFGLKITPAGAKVYVFQYRRGGRRGRSRRYTIGRHGTDWTADEARKEARELARKVAKGRDPGAEREKAKKAETISELAARFLSEHVIPKTRPRTRKEYERLVEKIILPALGNRKVAEVTKGDVYALHYARRDTPRDANHMLSVLSKMFTLAEVWDLRAPGSNPCRYVERYKEQKRERFLSEPELARLGEALAEAGREGAVDPYAIAAIRLLIFTGARVSEVITLRWEYVDLEGAALRLPESKTGPKAIYLAPPALEVLDGLDRLEEEPHVFPGKREGAHLTTLQKTWDHVRQKAALDGVRLHDLRHSFASMGAAGGLSLPVIGALLGHTQAATTQRYAHLAADPLKQASDLIGSRIAAAMQGEGKGKVVPLKRPQKKR